MPIRTQTTAITAITWTGTTTTTTFAKASAAAMKMATTAGINMAAILTAHIAYLMPSCRKYSASSRFVKRTEKVAGGT